MEAEEAAGEDEVDEEKESDGLVNKLVFFVPPIYEISFIQMPKLPLTFQVNF